MNKADAVIRVQGGRRVHPMGGSLAVVIPRVWLSLYAFEHDGKFWVKLVQSGKQIVIEGLNADSVNKMLEVNKCQVNKS